MPSNDLLNGYWIPNRAMVFLRTIALYEFLDFGDWQVNVVLEFLDMVRVLDRCVTQVNGWAFKLFFEERNLISVDVIVTTSAHQCNSPVVGDLGDQMSQCSVLGYVKGAACGKIP